MVEWRKMTRGHRLETSELSIDVWPVCEYVTCRLGMKHKKTGYRFTVYDKADRAYVDNGFMPDIDLDGICESLMQKHRI